MTKDIDIDLEIEADEVAYIYLGTDKHNNLKNLDLPDSHPIRAITGLQEVVDKVGRTEDGAEVNEIIGVKVNGAPLDIAEDRTVDVPVPTSYGYYLDLDGNNGVISLKDRNGVVLSTIDTNLERIVKSGRYDADTNELVLVLDDNSEIRIDASKLVDVYTADGETIVESGHVFALSKGSKDALKDSADHIADRSNPHNVTKDQVGLGNVDNTSDMGKPISTLVQQALDGKADDSAVVHKTGQETITGKKIFGEVEITGLSKVHRDGGITFIFQQNIMDCSDTAPTTNTENMLMFSDVNNKEVARVCVYRKPTSNSIAIGSSYYADGDTSKVPHRNLISIISPHDGSEAYAVSLNVSNLAKNDNTIATCRWVNGASSVVHTTGNETIAGTKTLSNIPIISSNSWNGIYFKSPKYDATVGAEGDRRPIDIRAYDKNEVSCGGIFLNLYTSSTKLRLVSTDNIGDGSKTAEVQIIADNTNGLAYVTAPVTADTHPDNAIVTKKYLLDKIAALEARISALEGAR